jgi:pre-mRNA-splicing helicase BRR2
MVSSVEDAGVLSQISSALRLGIDETRFAKQNGQLGDAHAKVLVLLYAHFNRFGLSSDLQRDLDRDILPTAHRLVLTLVDVVSTCGWLKVALSAMEIGPMLVQAMVPSACPLLQLPHFDSDRCEQATSSLHVEDVMDVLQMSEEDRASLLTGLCEDQVSEIATACNAFPSINLSADRSEDGLTIQVKLEREGEKRPVCAPYFPKSKEEGWWLVLARDNEIEDLKRISISKNSERVILHSESAGQKKLFLMSDSYIGCDQEEEI